MQKTVVSKLATDLFKNIKDRMTKNVMLKFYNFFLVPLQVDLWNEIQREISTLSDEDLSQYFQVSTTKDKLKADEKRLDTILKRCTEQEAEFVLASKQFSHPNARDEDGKD